MNLLPKKVDIDKQRNEEIRKEIDSGVQLANNIDRLRETKANEEKALFEWRASSIRLVQQDIDKYIDVRDNLKRQTEEAEVYRKKLIEPLDAEWSEVNIAKSEVSRQSKAIAKAKESLKVEIDKIKAKLAEVSEVNTRSKKNQEDTLKAKEQVLALRDMAQREYEVAKEEHDRQTSDHEKAMLHVKQTEEEYEVALRIIEIRENQVKEKEVELITRENYLTTQQKVLQIAQKEIQK